MTSSADPSTPDRTEAHRRLREFCRGATEDRLFIYPTGHPTEPTGFCPCEGSWWRAGRFYARALLMALIFKLPCSGLKVWFLRRVGARVGRRVHFCEDVWIDPVFPELLTIEDGVFFGMGAKVFTHEIRLHEFRAGKVLIRQGAFIGGFAVIGCGVEIGASAVVAACSIADRDVPAHATLISAPSRIVKRPQTD